MKVNKLTNTLFIVLLFSITILNVFVMPNSFSENENRKLQQFPSFSLRSFIKGKFSMQFETWMQDQFIHRDTWIMVNTLKELALGKTINNEVYFGKEHYLLERFVQEDFKIAKQNIEYLNAFKRPVTLMLIPSSVEVNRDKLPRFAYNTNQKELEDWIVSQLDDHIQVVPLYNRLVSCKDCFYKTDHHWNLKGAYIAYQVLMEMLNESAYPLTMETVSKDFKGTMFSKSGAFWMPKDEIETIKEVHEIPVKVRVDDQEYTSLFFPENLKKKDQYTYYLDGNHSLVHIHNLSLQNDKHIVIVKDSFAHAFVPMLMLHFEEITMIDLRYYRQSISKYIQEHEIDDIIVMYNIKQFVNDSNFVFFK